MLERILLRLRGEAIICAEAKQIPVPEKNGAFIISANPGSRHSQRVEYRLQIKSRATDDLQHIGGGGLLLERSLSSRVFSMAMTACAAKLLTNSICLSVKGRTSWR